jgi:O-antigen/teichoic acid export membrane protein
MENKQLVINLISNIIAFSSSFLIAFVLTPFLIENIGKEAYSFFPMSNNFIGYLTILTLALNSMVARYITIEVNKNNILKAKIYFSSTFFSNLVIIVLLIFPITLVIYYLDQILNIPIELLIDVKILFSLVFISMLINFLATVFGVATFATNRMDLKAIGDIFHGFFRIVVFIFLFYFYEASIVFIGIVAVILSFYNLAVQMFFTKKLMPEFKIYKEHFDLKAIKELTSSGGWNVINALGMSLLLGMSLFLTNYFIGAEAGGDLSITLMLPAFISGIITMIVSVLLPRLTKAYATEGKKELENELLYSQKILSVLTTVPIALLIVFGNDFFLLWIPGVYSDVLPKLSLILLLPLLIHGNMWSIYSVNVVLNKVKIPSLILLFSGGTALSLSLLLSSSIKENIFIIPIITTSISLLYYFLFIPSYTAKCMDIKLFVLYNNLLKTIGMISIYIVLAIYAKSLVIIGSWGDFFFWSTIFGTLGVVAHLGVILNKNERIKIYSICKYFIKRLTNHGRKNVQK